MTIDFDNADASWYYHENAAAEAARIDSSALSGNLADAMKNSVVILSEPKPVPSPQLVSVRQFVPLPSGVVRERQP